ncbi:MAG: class II fructose-bisphosphate aldolase [Candidatus Zipacnadales bacterium]
MRDLNELPLSTIMRRAADRHVLIPAFNVAHLPMVEAICATVRELNTFALVEVARPDVEKFGAQSFAAVAEEYRRHADRRYTRLHLDHVPVIDEDGQQVDWQPLIDSALKMGFDSVMIDGSRLPLEENIAVTRCVVTMAHATGRPVEAELGAVLGHEAGPLPPYEELFASGKGFTDPEEARRFVEETGCDWLSVAIGNIHGAISEADRDKTKVSARLNLDHLKKLHHATGVPLVLHGGSGIQPEYLRAAAREGIAKINVGTEIRQAFERTWRGTESLSQAQNAVAESVRQLVVEIYGVAGSADALAA